MKSLRPIFIIASPRSGTTMLGSMLGSHSKSVALPESPFIAKIYYEMLFDTPHVNTKEITNKINSNFRFAHWKLNKKPEDFIKKENLETEDYRNLIEEMILDYSNINNKNKISYWIEHSPWNSRMVSSLLKIFPNALFIHLVRDGRAICNSILPLDWGANNSIEAAHNWVEDLSYGFQAELTLKKEQCLRVFYENLIVNPKEELNRICNWIGLEFENDMIYGKDFNIPKYTKNQHSFVGDSPNKKRLDAWKSKLSNKQIKHFEDIAGFMLLNLKYKLSQEKKPLVVTPIERIKYTFGDFIRKEFINKVNILKRR